MPYVFLDMLIVIKLLLFVFMVLPINQVRANDWVCSDVVEALVQYNNGLNDRYNGYRIINALEAEEYIERTFPKEMFRTCDPRYLAQRENQEDYLLYPNGMIAAGFKTRHFYYGFMVDKSGEVSGIYVKFK
ncbi:hypothetical protein E1162_12180 [Rhodobacteraceae bacterium RKSG542]|uniref:hypothetical protein n=1 Tax=Pseudovibrio flavus TaxID=2529854 RepID=UPI0012BCC101|nr:hypothetical protein [Pseudovibrio flavus]MTI17995.1 hypothetical protein [Pseudovibrio flavus]